MLTKLNFQIFSRCGFRHLSSQVGLTLVAEKNGVRRITLNNPKKRNMLSSDMIQSLHESIFANGVDNLRCIVIDHKGPVFSSGHDLKELISLDRNNRMKIFESCSDMMIGLKKLPVPVIGVVNGLAAAAGCQLVASCDISVASDKSQFSTPGASVGLFCSTPGIAVSRNIPPKASAYMLFTGSNIGTQDALRWGLISKMATEEELEGTVNRIIEEIVAKDRSVIALGKKFFYEQISKDIETAYRLGSEVMVDNLGLSQAEEGISAFFEKRQPQW